ncbi:hypothetical protein PV04_07140 [Phialophora macrospora]|uniref:Uncharacterized protein n=1 Tax=Phialophora macrospora TaxID=1851006 RepID=A0A0D2FY51_9EURO|nr:hypothetical protein PV04_07140 [Phialophora macrospora]
MPSKVPIIYLFKPPSDKRYGNPQWIGEKVTQFSIRLNASQKAFGLESSKNLVTSPPLRSAFNDIEIQLREPGTDEESKVSSNDRSHSTDSALPNVNCHRWLNSIVIFASERIPFSKNMVTDFLKSRQNLEGLRMMLL